MAKPVLRLAALLVALAPLACSGATPRVVVETLDDETACRLEELDFASGTMRVSQDALGEDPLGEAIAIRFGPLITDALDEPAESITLVDGTTFAAAGHGVQDDRIEFRLTAGGSIGVPISTVRFWALSPEALELVADAGSGDALTDRLVIRARSGEGLTPVDGVVQGIDSAGVDFQLGADSGGDLVRAAWRRIAGVRFYRPNAGTSSPVAVVLAGGARFAADSVAVEGGSVRWSSEPGSQGKAPLRAVSRIDLAANRVTSVDELPLLSSDWVPHGGALLRDASHAFDRGIDGRPLRLRHPDPRAPDAWPAVGVIQGFSKGVALASQGTLRFRLPPGAKRVKCLVGLDPATSEAGDCQASLLLDGRTAWSGRVSGETAPAPVVIDPVGAETLTLRVDYGANLDAGDRVHFANLRVIR